MTDLHALSDVLYGALMSRSSGKGGLPKFWQYAPEVPEERLSGSLKQIAIELDRGLASGGIRYDLILFHLLRIKLTNVHGNRLWPAVAQSLWPTGSEWSSTEHAAKFFRAQLAKHHGPRLKELAVHRRFLCLAFEQAGVGYNRLNSILRFLGLAINALPNPLEQPRKQELSALVNRFTSRETGLEGLESTLLISLEAVVLVRAALAKQRKLFASSLWSFERLCQFASSEAGIDLTTVIPEARDAFLHAFRFGHQSQLTQSEAFELRLRHDCGLEVPPSRPLSPLGMPIGPARINTEDGCRYDVQICSGNGEDASSILAHIERNPRTLVDGRECVWETPPVVEPIVWPPDRTPIYIGRSVDEAHLAAVLRIERDPKPKIVLSAGINRAETGDLIVKGDQLLEFGTARVECHGNAAIVSPSSAPVMLTSDSDPVPSFIGVTDDDDNVWDAPITFSKGGVQIRYGDLPALGILAPGFYKLASGQSRTQRVLLLVMSSDTLVVHETPIGVVSHLSFTEHLSEPRPSLTAPTPILWVLGTGSIPPRVGLEERIPGARVVVSWAPRVRDCVLYISNETVRGDIGPKTAWNPGANFHAVGGRCLLQLLGSDACDVDFDGSLPVREVLGKAKRSGVLSGTLQARVNSSGPVLRQWKFDIRPRAAVSQVEIRREGDEVRVSCKGGSDGPGGSIVRLTIIVAGGEVLSKESSIEPNEQPAIIRSFLIGASLPSALVSRLDEVDVVVYLDAEPIDVREIRRIETAEIAPGTPAGSTALKGLLVAARDLSALPLTEKILDICLRSASSNRILPLSLDIVDGRLSFAERGIRDSIMLVLGRVDAYLRRGIVVPLEALRPDLLAPAVDVLVCLELLGEIANSARGQLDPKRVIYLSALDACQSSGESAFLAEEAMAIMEHRRPRSAVTTGILSTLYARYGFRADALAIIVRRHQLPN